MGKSKNQDGSRRRSGNVLERNRKTLLLAGGGLLLAVGGYNLLNLSQLNKELQIEQITSIYRMTLTGITMRVDVTLKNPTPGQINVKTPFVTISFNGEPLGQSDNLSANNQLVPSYGQVQLDPIYITLRYLNLAMTARNFWEAYMNKGRATIAIRALTRINDVFPVENTTTFELGTTPPAGGTTPTLSGLMRVQEQAKRLLSEQPAAFYPQRRSQRRLAS